MLGTHLNTLNQTRLTDAHELGVTLKVAGEAVVALLTAPLLIPATR
jgi:hypothetical protein